jgi:preprotein translocase subunit SecD
MRARPSQLVVAVALLVAGCGGSSAPRSHPASPTPQPAATPARGMATLDVVAHSITPGAPVVSSSRLDIAEAIVINRLRGVAIEPEIVETDNGFRITMPQADVGIATGLITEPGRLEFRRPIAEGPLVVRPPIRVLPDTRLPTRAKAKRLYDVFRCFQEPNLVDNPNDYLVACDRRRTKYLLGPVGVSGSEISGATAMQPAIGAAASWVVDVTFKSRGKAQFAALTRQAWNAYRSDPGDPSAQVAIVLDKTVISAPVIDQGPVVGGAASISGDFRLAQAKALATVLQFGALPVRLTVASVVHGHGRR